MMYLLGMSSNTRHAIGRPDATAQCDCQLSSCHLKGMVVLLVDRVCPDLAIAKFCIDALDAPDWIVPPPLSGIIERRRHDGVHHRLDGPQIREPV